MSAPGYKTTYQNLLLDAYVRKRYQNKQESNVAPYCLLGLRRVDLYLR
jgi:hypothetical protein